MNEGTLLKELYTFTITNSMLIVASLSTGFILKLTTRIDSKLVYRRDLRLALCPRVCSVLVPTIISDTALPTLLSSHTRHQIPTTGYTGTV